MTPPQPCPPEWSDWELALEDEMMMRSYGWTLDEIDALSDAQRERVRYGWAVRAIHSEAEAEYAAWAKQQAGVVNFVDRMKAGGA